MIWRGMISRMHFCVAYAYGLLKVRLFSCILSEELQYRPELFLTVAVLCSLRTSRCSVANTKALMPRVHDNNCGCGDLAACDGT